MAPSASSSRAAGAVDPPAGRVAGSRHRLEWRARRRDYDTGVSVEQRGPYGHDQAAGLGWRRGAADEVVSGFDCDVDINDPLEIWSEYVADVDREAVRSFYWQDEHQTILNGRTLVMGGQSHYFRPLYNPILMAGPQMNKAIIRKLLMDVVTGKLTEEQVRQVEHDGAVDGAARCTTWT